MWISVVLQKLKPPSHPIVIVRQPHLGVEIASARKRFLHTLLTSKLATMTQSAQTTIPPNRHKAPGLSGSKIKW